MIHAKITEEWRQQMTVNSLNWLSSRRIVYSHFLAFATIITWRARFGAEEYWLWYIEDGAFCVSWVSWNRQVSNSKVKQLWKLLIADNEPKNISYMKLLKIVVYGYGKIHGS